MFEPHSASAVIDRYAATAGIEVLRRQFLESVELSGRTIVSIRLLGGLKVRAKVFIDATYEGDLMAMSGVSFTCGREANSKYGETINGVEVRATHQFRPSR